LRNGFEDHVACNIGQSLHTFAVAHGHSDRQCHNAVHHGPENIAAGFGIASLYHACIHRGLDRILQYPKRYQARLLLSERQLNRLTGQEPS